MTLFDLTSVVKVSDGCSLTVKWPLLLTSTTYVQNYLENMCRTAFLCLLFYSVLLWPALDHEVFKYGLRIHVVPFLDIYQHPIELELFLAHLTDPRAPNVKQLHFGL